MQHQVGKQVLSSGLGEDGGLGWNSRKPTSGSGSWASTANQEGSAGSSNLTAGKSDSASDAGDDTSSVKSGSAITNISNITTQQSQDSSVTTASGALPINSSSPWSSSTPLPGLESGPWGNSNSPAPTSLGNFGWNTTPSSLSLPTNNQGLSNNMQPNIGSSMSFNSAIGNNSSGWPTGISNNPLSTTSVPPNMASGLSSGTISSQWQGSNNIMGNIDFPKSSEANWNNAVLDGTMNKENNSDPRMWGLSTEKPTDGQWQSKPQWNNSPLEAGGDQGMNNSAELSFAQAALKGIKPPPATPKPPSTLSVKQEEILRAIENHEGWGSRPINQETNWDVESSPKSHRKFSVENSPAQASNVWNNRNGTAIWDSVRDNSSWSGNASNAGKPWNGDKDQSNWGAMSKPAQDNWAPGNASGADSKSFGMWGGPGAGGDASSKMWGQKPEVRSWGDSNNGRPGPLSSWGDDAESSGWEDPRRVQGGIGAPVPGMIPPNPGMPGPGMPGVVPQGMPGMNNMQSVTPDNGPTWNDSQKSGWNSAGGGGMQRPKMDEPWNKPPPKITGWGDPVPEPVKIDDGTSLWASSGVKQMPPQPKPGGWGETTAPQGQWNAAVGSKPKPAGWDEASYAMAQRAKSGGNPNDVSGNSVDVGYWNGLPQDNNTWNDPAALRGVRKITGQQIAPPKYIGSGGGHPTQMRAKLLQQLMDMGFRKEEAQNALITNNMNLEMAINELRSNNGMMRKDMDMEMYQSNGSQSRMPPYMPNSGRNDDFSDPSRSDQVPNFNMTMQNTPLSNAQIPNQPFLQNSASLPPSSLNSNTSSINSNVHSKLIQKMQHVAPPGNAIGSRGQMPQSSSEQVQQHIVSQLRMAVNSGIISPQLLNHTLPRNMLVLLQQLLQLQASRQSLMARLQQTNRQGSRQQIDQNNSMMNSINQQMMTLQKQLQHAQNVFFSSQKPPNMSQPPSNIITMSGSQQGNTLAESIEVLSSELANASIGNQSRLTTQYKMGSETPMSMENSAVSSSGLLQTVNINNDDKSGGANYMNLIGGGLGITGDRTWSSVSSSASSSQNWPSTSGDTINTSASAEQKGSGSSIVTSPGLSGLTDVIPEFIPGKPWQGLSKSSIEDDPHITPGSIQRSLSVNRVHDDSLNSLSSSKFESQKSWSSSSKNENSLGLGNLGSRPPPGVIPPKMVGSQPWQQGGNAVYSRQTSWAGRSGNSAFTQVGASNWNESQGSNWIVLKNLTFIDSATTRALCQRHGDVINFYYIPDNQAALIQYGNRDVAFSAQRALNNFTMGTSTLKADFISDNDAQRAISQLPSQSFQQNMGPINTSQWSQAPPTGFQATGGNRGGEIWSQPWSGPSLWGETSSVADQNCNPLLSHLGLLD